MQTGHLHFFCSRWNLLGVFFGKKKKTGGQDFCYNMHHWSMVSLFQQGNTNQALRWPPHHMTAQPIRGQAEEPGRHSNKRWPHRPIAAQQFWIMTDPFSNYQNTKRGFASFISQQTIKTVRLTGMEKCRSFFWLILRKSTTSHICQYMSQTYPNQ